MVGLLVNAGFAEAGIGICAAGTTLGIAQDNEDGSLWAALGVSNGTFIVVDQSGILVLEARLTLPGGNSTIEDTVEPLLD